MNRGSGSFGLLLGVVVLSECLRHWLVTACVLVLLLRAWLALSPAARVGSALGLLSGVLGGGRRF